MLETVPNTDDAEKNHYCGHFLSIIKKKLQSSYSDLNCLEKACNKKFPSFVRIEYNTRNF